MCNTNRLLHCSFCGNSQNEVEKLIAGPTVYICNECVLLCLEILVDEMRPESDKGPCEGKPISTTVFTAELKRLGLEGKGPYSQSELVKASLAFCLSQMKKTRICKKITNIEAKHQAELAPLKAEMEQL